MRILFSKVSPVSDCEFTSRDRVTAAPEQIEKNGTVVHVYEFAGEHRCIVRFDDGTEGKEKERSLFQFRIKA